MPCSLLLQGSGAKDPAAFAAAIAKARSVSDAGLALGFDMNTVDIGGGYISCAAPGAHVGSARMLRLSTSNIIRLVLLWLRTEVP
jgi:diaminopimelate decarboxylase